ncbi:hypothetical protein D3C87_1135010 [compost metagenome]
MRSRPMASKARCGVTDMALKKIPKASTLSIMAACPAKSALIQTARISLEKAAIPETITSITRNMAFEDKARTAVILPSSPCSFHWAIAGKNAAVRLP